MLPIKQSLSWPNYKKELIAIIGNVITIFIGFSLYSYSSTDPSWFYYTSYSLPVKNMCGIVGSYSAAALFFFFGIAAYGLLPLGILLSFWIAFRFQWWQEWERFIAGIIFLITIATLCSLHRITLGYGAIAGGFVGYAFASFLYQFFDHVGSLIFLYTCFIACLIIMIRFSCITWAQYMWNGIRYSYDILINSRIKYHFWYVVSVTRKLGQKIVQRYQFFVEKLYKHFFTEDIVFDVDDTIQEYRNIVISEKKSNKEDVTGLDMPQSNDIVVGSNNDTENDATTVYGLPSLDIFIGIKEKKENKEYRNELEEQARILEQKLERFGIYGKITAIKSGPVVTLFEYQPSIDTKLSKILALEDDLALALQALSIRIIAPIPGRSVVGFEVANKERRDVVLSHVIHAPEYVEFEGLLPLILGKDTIGNNVIVDLTKMPHLLIAGSTGSGKSVALNAMLMSLLCCRAPDELRLILIDPKRLEFSAYADIAHLLFPIVTEPKRSIPILRWIVYQMEDRYEKMAQYGARNIFDYNRIMRDHTQEKFPFIVVVIDELSDLMLTVGREIEDVILRITQMARAAGIHMIVATQRPSVDVITGLIKVNFPSRISFRVTSRIDSRTILDCGGADKLLGRGDMLFLDSTASILKRIHGAYVSDKEINMVVNHIKNQQVVRYCDPKEQLSEHDIEFSLDDQALYEQIVVYLGEIEEISISLLQRKFRIGYNRSARIIDILESRGLIMPADGGKTRRVIR